jgi:hypothetical protein
MEAGWGEAMKLNANCQSKLIPLLRELLSKKIKSSAIYI